MAMLRSKKKQAVRYAVVGLVEEAIGPAQGFRRHTPPLLFLLAQIALFFFQAEDGIRDLTVTGVQTCALPIWAWLIGPFVDGWLRVYPDDFDGARRFLEGFKTHLGDACIGQISEVFDASEPFIPRDRKSVV